MGFGVEGLGFRVEGLGFRAGDLNAIPSAVSKVVGCFTGVYPDLE